MTTTPRPESWLRQKAAQHAAVPEYQAFNIPKLVSFEAGATALAAELKRRWSLRTDVRADFLEEIVASIDELLGTRSKTADTDEGGEKL